MFGSRNKLNSQIKTFLPQQQSFLVRIGEREFKKVGWRKEEVMFDNEDVE